MADVKKTAVAPAWVKPADRAAWLEAHPWHGDHPEWAMDPDLILHVATEMAHAHFGDKTSDPSGFMSQAADFVAASNAMKTFKPVDRSKPTPAELAQVEANKAALKADPTSADAQAKVKSDEAMLASYKAPEPPKVVSPGPAPASPITGSPRDIKAEFDAGQAAAKAGQSIAPGATVEWLDGYHSVTPAAPKEPAPVV